MWRVAFILPLAIAMATSGSAQAPAADSSPSFTASVGNSLNDWRALRQSSNYPFATYARFLIANPGWPDDSRMRGWAEAAMHPGENAATVIAFFAVDKPASGKGWARLADAYSASGQPAEAIDAARDAWGEADLGLDDEQAIWARYGASFTRADHDRRLDSLLFAKKPDAARRFLSYASPDRQAAFSARIAMQDDSDDAEARYGAVIGWVTRDAGLMMDRARYLRAHDYDKSARQLGARAHDFIYRPTDPERFYEMLIVLAEDAEQARDWSTAYNIARQLDDALPPGTDVTAQSYGIRDNYTTLAWLAGNVALDRLHNYPGAQAMFHRYSRGGQSLQVLTKGEYWAGRAALSAGRKADSTAYFQRAAAYPELFYGQLALERLGRAVPAPPTAIPQYVTTATQRAAFNTRRQVEALKILGQQRRSEEQALFVRSLSESLATDPDRNLAVELAQQLHRQDLPVWVARSARNGGSMFYVRQAYPLLATAGTGTVVHGIARQESSFDPYAVSHAGALGMMQLMRGTAREQAGKLGVGYDSGRLLSDPSYNVLLGSTYFRRLLDRWDGSVPLAVASYNAGSGNVSKWIRTYGDPRGQVDMVKWIEAIPFTETKGYVERVIENSVVYDAIGRSQTQQTAVHVSRYLGKGVPG